MVHAIKLVEAFHLEKNTSLKPSMVPLALSVKSQKVQRGDSSYKPLLVARFFHGPEKNLFVCQFNPQKAKVYCRLLHDCTAYLETKNKTLFKKRAEILAKEGASKCTRSQKSAAKYGSIILHKPDHKFYPAVTKPTGSSRPKIMPNFFSVTVKLSDGPQSVTSKRRFRRC